MPGRLPGRGARRPPSFGAPTATLDRAPGEPVMGDPLSVPEDPGIGYGIAPAVPASEDALDVSLASVASFVPAGYADYDEDAVVWWEPPADLQGVARLGIVHTDESCPLVILRVLDDAGETETVGSFDHVLSLAQWINRVCDITPCIANGVVQATRDAAQRTAG
jgi:hypothetical protein